VENANLAIDALIQLGLVKRIRQYDAAEYIRLTDCSNVMSVCARISGIDDVALESGAADPLLLEVSKFFCTVYPKPNIAIMCDLLVDRLNSHGLWLTTTLYGNRRPASNLLPELKKFADSEDMLSLLIALQFRSGDATTDRLRWKIFNLHDSLKSRFRELKVIMANIDPPCTSHSSQKVISNASS
jgi:hypothetical protein